MANLGNTNIYGDVYVANKATIKGLLESLGKNVFYSTWAAGPDSSGDMSVVIQDGPGTTTGAALTIKSLASSSPNGWAVVAASSSAGIGNGNFGVWSNDARAWKLKLQKDGELFIGNTATSKVWHAGNDGSGSGLDADLLDGKHANAFLLLTGGTLTGILNTNSDIVINGNIDYRRFLIRRTVNSKIYEASIGVHGTHLGTILRARNHTDNIEKDLIINSSGAITWDGQKVWHAGNDGSGSGLDADLLDGKHASEFSLTSHNHDSVYLKLTGGTINNGNILFNTTMTGIKWSLNSDEALICFKNDGDSDTDSHLLFQTGDNGNEFFKWAMRSGSTHTELMTLKSDALRFKGNTVWHAANDGSGSGLDADLLDGKHANAFLLLTGGTLTGNLYTNSDIVINGGTNYKSFRVNRTVASKVYNGYLAVSGDNGSVAIKAENVTDNIQKDLILNPSGAITWGGQKVWNQGNDGRGSGLDADLFDGIDSDKFEKYKVVEITVGGDANTYYPVAIKPTTSVNYVPFEGKMEIFRDYNWSAPDTWNTATHKGGLGITLKYALQGYGRQDYYFSGNIWQTYTKIIGNMYMATPDTSTLIVYLRGGNARYHIKCTREFTHTVTLGTYTHTASSGATSTHAPLTTPKGGFNTTNINQEFSSITVEHRSSRSDMSSALKISYTPTQMQVHGDVRASKIYGAVYNDYAEYFEKSDVIEPGDVVELDYSSEKETYIKSSSIYSKFVVGVCSDEYFQCIGGRGDEYDADNYTPVGLAGRVKVKTIGYAKKGDFLVSSKIPGIAMAVEDAPPGTIIGKVLENKDYEEIGRIRMLIQLQ